MAYIGRDTDKLSNIEVLDTITFDGSSSYTLQKNSVNFTPSSANNVLVSIDGVVQANNFTVSGSTINFGVAVPSTSTCDWIYHIGVGLITTPADGTVSLAKLSATGTKDATTFLRGDNTFSTISAGITEADMWRLNANYSGAASFITANLERPDNSDFGYVGTGMTESSGVFTFPSTGIYHVTANFQYSYAGDSRANYCYIYTTTDNSTYNGVAWNSGFIQITSGNTTHNNASTSIFFDVTNTSTHKVKFYFSPQTTGVTLSGNTDINTTFMTFIKLGDT